MGKMRMSIVLSIVLAGGAANTSMAASNHRHLPCRALHSGRYCFVKEHRAAIRNLRQEARREARRLGQSRMRFHRLSYEPDQLDRGLRWMHRKVEKMKRTPTPVRYSVAHYDQWICIHHGEGAWDSNTGNGYYGGLQMDLSFQQAYGPEFLARWGTADNWPPLAQMEAAERALPSRGFGPWPLTAARCGLL